MKLETIAKLSYFVSICFYIASVISFFTDKSYAVIWLALGSVFLCLGSLNVANAKKEAAKKEAEEAEANQNAEA